MCQKIGGFFSPPFASICHETWGKFGSFKPFFRVFKQVFPRFSDQPGSNSLKGAISSSGQPGRVEAGLNTIWSWYISHIYIYMWLISGIPFVIIIFEFWVYDALVMPWRSCWFLELFRAIWKKNIFKKWWVLKTFFPILEDTYFSFLFFSMSSLVLAWYLSWESICCITIVGPPLSWYVQRFPESSTWFAHVYPTSSKTLGLQKCRPIAFLATLMFAQLPRSLRDVVEFFGAQLPMAWFLTRSLRWGLCLQPLNCWIQTRRGRKSCRRPWHPWHPWLSQWGKYSNTLRQHIAPETPQIYTYLSHIYYNSCSRPSKMWDPGSGTNQIADSSTGLTMGCGQGNLAEGGRRWLRSITGWWL